MKKKEPFTKEDIEKFKEDIKKVLEGLRKSQELLDTLSPEEILALKEKAEKKYGETLHNINESAEIYQKIKAQTPQKMKRSEKDAQLIAAIEHQKELQTIRNKRKGRRRDIKDWKGCQ